MCDKTVAVFDIGKTRSRLVVLANDGSTAYAAERASTSLTSGPYQHLDTDATWLWMLQSLRDSGFAASVSDCVVVTHGAAFALLADGELAVPVMDYEYTGFESLNTTYDRQRDSFDATYSPRLAAGLNAGRQIFYIQQTLPSEFARVSAIVPYPQYWAARLCGVLASEATSLGCHTDLWRPVDRQFSSLVADQGWRDLMPPQRSAWEVLGTVLPNVARPTGLNPGCRIHCGIHDSNASYLQHLRGENDRFCVVSTGTWVVCMAGGHEIDNLDEDRDMLANVDVFANPVPCARFMGGREFALILGDVESMDDPNLDHARDVMTHGSMALPSFADGGGPYPGTRGDIINPPKTTTGRRAMASLYCALMTDACLDALDASGDLIIEGRFIRDSLFIEALAHFRRHQVLRISDDSAGTIGGAKRLIDWPKESPALPPVYTTAEPSFIYRQYRDRWRKALKQYSANEKVRIVLDGLRGEDSFSG